MLVYSPEKIIAARKSLGLNQSELARRSKLSAPTIWALEKGDTVEPKYETLRDVASALGIPLQAIMSDSQPNDIDDQINAAAANLTAANKGALLAAARALLDSQKK
jgi:transcriptional regulator with XRE-family HTH domain